MADWHTAATIAEQWRDADKLSAEELEELLEIAREACVTYGPAFTIPEGEPNTWIPTAWRRAQRLAVEDEWNTSNAEQSAADVDTYPGINGDVRVYRLTMRVKRLLMPESRTEGLVG